VGTKKDNEEKIKMAWLNGTEKKEKRERKSGVL
jgi:hypothetical protein